MLTQLGGTAMRISGSLLQNDGHADQACLADGRVLIIDHIAISYYLRIVGQVRNSVDDCINKIATLFQDLQPFGTRLGRKDLVENRYQFSMVLGARPHVIEAFIINQLGNTESMTEILPVA